ncbi:hypothetical protein [Streptomyces luteireticuli]|uniref:hypothetical protein n=1 Tax=Streptomyces luteireticuli TaxID=173858 RepID=UPI003557B025
MPDVVRWILSTASTLFVVILMVKAFSAWVRKDWGQMVAALVGCALVSAFIWAGDAVVRAVSGVLGDAAPRRERPKDVSGKETPGLDIPWHAVLTVVGALLALLAVVVAVVGLERLHRRRRRERRRLDDLTARHDAVREAYGAFESNMLENLDRLALADVTVPQTARLIDALDAARDARMAARAGALTEFRRSVTALELAWAEADHYARKTGAGYLPENERRNIEQARLALALALDDAGNPHERRLAYERAVGLIEQVIPVPRHAVAVLEGQTRLALGKP